MALFPLRSLPRAGLNGLGISRRTPSISASRLRAPAPLALLGGTRSFRSGLQRREVASSKLSYSEGPAEVSAVWASHFKIFSPGKERRHRRL